MEEDFFKVGHTTYLQRKPRTQKKWTSRFWKKILEHKVITLTLVTIFICVCVNFWLLYRFMSILENI